MALTIPGENTHLNSDSNLTCFFNINQKPAEKYQLEIIDGNGRETVLKDAFLVEAFPLVSDLNEKLKPFFFEFDKSVIKNDQLDRLKDDLAILNSNPQLYILLGGHSDERGTRSYNLKLSAQRAETIKKYLIQAGIAPEKIMIYAYGKDFPAKKGHSEADWKTNRRVDILVWETPPAKEQGIRDWSDDTQVNYKMLPSGL